MSMFCYQCEQTAKGTGCDVSGVCGKNPEVAALQDMLIHCTKMLGRFVTELRAMGVKDREADRFIVEALFATVTNVDFDPERLEKTLRELFSETAKEAQKKSAIQSQDLLKGFGM